MFSTHDDIGRVGLAHVTWIFGEGIDVGARLLLYIEEAGEGIENQGRT